MRYFNYTLFGLALIINSFANGATSNIIQVTGFFNDISPDEEWVLFRTPDDMEPGELHTGVLNAVHVVTGQIIHILNTFIEQPSTFFFDNNIVAIPRKGIELYDLTKKKFKPKPLVTYPKAYGLLQFSLSEDKSKVAMLLLDWDRSINHIKENQAYNRVELRIIDLKSKQTYKVDHYTYRSGESRYRIGDIMWHGDQVVYSFQSKLYYYQLGNPRRICFTNLMEKYAINKDELVYETAGYGKDRYEMDKLHYKIFSFKDLTVRDVSMEEEENMCIVTEAPDYPSYFFRLENGKFKDQDGLVLYRGKKVIVKTVGNNLLITKL